MIAQKKELFAFFDIDGTFRNRTLPELIKDHILNGNFTYRGDQYDKFNQFKNELASLRKKYKKLEGIEASKAFGEYCERISDFVMFALEKYKPEEVMKIASRLVSESKDEEDYLFTKTLLNTLKSIGFKCIIISGSPKFLIDAFAKEYGFDDSVAQDYEKNPQTHIYEPVLPYTWHAKNKLIEEYFMKNNIYRNNISIVSIGDTIGDFEMLRYSDIGFMMNPSKELYAKVLQDIIENDLESCKYYHVIERKKFPYIYGLRKPRNCDNIKQECTSLVGSPFLDIEDISKYVKNILFRKGIYQ